MQDLLLVAQGDLGIGDKEGREQGIGLAAFPAEYTLDAEADRIGKVFYRSLIMSKKDQASPFSAGTLDHMQLQAIYQFFI